MSDFDLFISYRRKDSEHVLPLVAAFRQRGVSLWFDQQAINELAPITDEIRRGLSRCKALLAWYSEEYPQSRPCQMELTAALLAAEREGDARRRVLVINPGASAAHIEPVELRDAQYAGGPADAMECAQLAERVATHVAGLSGPLGGILPIVPPIQYGLTLTGANRFVGRLHDMWRIHSALHASESAIISGTAASGLAIVSGFGGVGKSLLAEEFALRFGAAYPGGIFWLRADGNHRPHAPDAAQADAGRLEQFAAIAAAFGIEIKGLNPGQIEAQLRARLSQNGRPFLWIVDDLAAGLDASRLKAWLAPAPVGKTLVTTRSREYGAIGTPIPLDVLKPREALDLLCSRRTPVDAVEEAAAEGITQDLGYHALAVEVTGAALAAHAGVMSFVTFRTNLFNPSEDELELAADLADMLPTGHEKSVAATILRSIRDLPEAGRDFLRLASLLAVAPIPPELVVATFLQVDKLGTDGGGKHQQPRAWFRVHGFGTAVLTPLRRWLFRWARASDTGTAPASEPDAMRRAIIGQRQAEQASLAERGEGDARLVHALVSRTMRFHDEKSDRRDALRAALVSVLATVLQEVVTRSLRAFPLEVQHAQALLQSTEQWDRNTAVLAAFVARLNYQRGLYVAARLLLERVLEVQRQVLGEDHPDRLVIMNSLAATVKAQGDLACARELLERVLEVQRRLLGKDDPAMLTTMNNLGETLRAQGDLASARRLQERVLEARRRVLGEDHPDTLLSMNNLAGLMQTLGDPANACELQKRVLETQRRVLGEDHPDTLMSMGNIAVTRRVMGDLAGARELQERTLEALRRVLGADHPLTLTVMHNLAATFRMQGDMSAARDLLQSVLEAQRRVLGERHADTLMSMSGLAEMLRAQGDVSGARELQERVLEAQRQLLGEDHPQTLLTINNLAETLRAQGNLDRARGLHERVLAARRRLLGENHPDTLVTMQNLAATLEAQAELIAARGLQEQVLEARRRVLGEDHPDTVSIINNLAVTLRRQGDLVGARKLQERALEALRRVMSNRHESFTVSAWNLFRMLLDAGDDQAAMRLAADALSWLRDADSSQLTAAQRAVKRAIQRTLSQSPDLLTGTAGEPYADKTPSEQNGE